MGNGAYSALYIINAVSVSKEFELSINFTYQFSYLYNDDCKLYYCTSMLI